MNAPVRVGNVTTTFSGVVEQQFVKLLTKKIEDQKAVIEAGQLASFDEYKRHTGLLNGYKEALDIWQQAVRDVQQAEGSLRRAI